MRQLYGVQRTPKVGTPGYSYNSELAGGYAADSCCWSCFAWPSLPSVGSVITIEGRRQVNSAGGLCWTLSRNIIGLVFLEAYKRVLRALVAQSPVGRHCNIS